MKYQIAAWASLAHSVAALSPYDYATPGGQVRFWQSDESTEEGVVTQMPFLTGAGFATLPVSDCFRDDDSEEFRYDIAILGAPHDTVGEGFAQRIDEMLTRSLDYHGSARRQIRPPCYPTRQQPENIWVERVYQ